jgi:hypothetical protein
MCLFAVSIPAHSQQKPGMTGEAIVASEPGKAAAMKTVELRGTVTAIDKARRAVSVKGATRTVEVIAGDEVRNFDQIKVGDEMVVRFIEALTLELKKTRGQTGASVSGAAARAAPGSRPAGAMGREVTILADVVAVDPAKKIITLRGPQGNVVDLPVQNADHFKVVQKGDQVEAVYTEAVAVAIVPAKK